MAALSQGSPPAVPAPEAKSARELKSTGIPARTAPTEYQAQARAGAITIAADFTGHSVATPDAVFSTEDFLAAEVAFYGPKDAHLALSFQDFSLRINGKKTAIPATGDQFVFHSLKDPSWEPPAPPEKSKTGINTGGGGANDPPPVAPKMPIGVERAMEQRVLKAALPEGDHPLPVGGLIFFQYGGRVKGIKSLELIYNGAAGKATLSLQP